MDNTAIAIAVGGTAIFVGVLLWKGLWLLRKIRDAEPGDAPPGE